ncbi:MAG: hypothetical protein COX44_00775 [Candidatus Portnoybacteria bacterium CG23_combo_of_CG06-09_8_20_14_all_37_13]|uniref:Addiction module toxin, HicA family n=1 Tax=Candidatus Portnoybacteria bacterium CG23_combo_of_CG06-09_8_20_14_all_37_13 TaxID=1974819 RepID=A0A2G9YDE5_9BACT|nr:MAG: hypothetical protein COX44_00775 [Candidatus Portnoybacteria bacterium CG23_combo_of_CG06-09_8_20_14_all_37_13]
MKLPTIKPKKVIQKLQKAGFVVDRQRGSHVVLFNKQNKKFVVVAYHNKDLKKGTIRNIIKQAGLTIEEFNKL